jgi:nucleotide-binding universal stress UspA family protein
LFKKILVPLDGSEHSSKALEIAAQIAKKFQAQLTLLQVYSFVAPVMMGESFTQTTSGLPIIRPSLTPADLAEMEKTARQFGERILIEAKEKLASEGIIVDSSLTEGD